MVCSQRTITEVDNGSYTYGTAQMVAIDSYTYMVPPRRPWGHGSYRPSASLTHYSTSILDALPPTLPKAGGYFDLVTIDPKDKQLQIRLHSSSESYTLWHSYYNYVQSRSCEAVHI